MNKVLKLQNDRHRSSFLAQSSSGGNEHISFPHLYKQEEDSLSRHEKEKAELAAQIGIDYENEKQKYSWFLDQLTEIELPREWLREDESDGKVIYFNESDGSTLTHHPLLNKFRTIFVDLLNSEEAGKKSIEEFLKQYKQRLKVTTLHKKEKVSPKRSFGGPIVVGSTLSQQILKEKVCLGNVASDKSLKQGTSNHVALMEEGKSKERFDKIKELLSKTKQSRLQQESQIDDIASAESLLEEYLKYYQAVYGEKLFQPPREIQSSEAYLEAEPKALVNAAKLFAIQPQETYLYWTLRVYISMPLPDFWTKEFDQASNSCVYTDLKTNSKLSVHPCYAWIKELIQFLRSQYKERKSEVMSASSKMVFQDQLKRTYESDIGIMLREARDGAKPRPLATYLNTSTTKMESLENVFRNRQEVNPKKVVLSQDLRDAHIVELANQAGVDINSEIHLLMVIEEFVISKEKDEKWFFKYVRNGECFWINHEHKKAVKEYPYLQELKKAINSFKEKQKDGESRKHKKDNTLIKTIFQKYTEETAMKILMEEAKDFTEFFFANRELKGNQSSLVDNKKVYSMRKLTKLIGSEMSKEDLFEILFYCPYNLEYGLGDLGFRSAHSLLNKVRRNRRETKKSDLDNDENSDLVPEAYQGRDLNINDPQKLISIAETLKEGARLSRVVTDTTKMEFLELIFDWDKKYGDDENQIAAEKTEERESGSRTNNAKKDSLKKLGSFGKVQGKAGTDTVPSQNLNSPNSQNKFSQQQKKLNSITDNKGFPSSVNPNSNQLSKTTNKVQKGESNFGQKDSKLNQGELTMNNSGEPIDNKSRLSNMKSFDSPKSGDDQIISPLSTKQGPDIGFNVEKGKLQENQPSTLTQISDNALNQAFGHLGNIKKRTQSSEGSSETENQTENVKTTVVYKKTTENIENSEENSSSSSSRSKQRSKSKTKTIKGKTFIAKDVNAGGSKKEKRNEFKSKGNYDVIEEDEIVIESHEVSEYEEIEFPDGRTELVKKKVRKQIPILKKKEKKTKKIKIKKRIKVKERDAFGREVEVFKEIEEETIVTDAEDENAEGKKSKKKTKKIYREADLFMEVEEMDRTGKMVKRLKQVTKRVVREVPWDYVEEETAKEIRKKIHRHLGRTESNTEDVSSAVMLQTNLRRPTLSMKKAHKDPASNTRKRLSTMSQATQVIPRSSRDSGLAQGTDGNYKSIEGEGENIEQQDYNEDIDGEATKEKEQKHQRAYKMLKKANIDEIDSNAPLRE